jgi:hypothetical protein
MHHVLAILFLSLCPSLFAQKAKKAATATADEAAVGGCGHHEAAGGHATQLDLFLLMGQSNMKGRGVMPEEPKRDPRIVMMHLKDDQWYLARHPLHLTGDAKTFQGHDNAGVGPGLAFAEVIAEQDRTARHRPRALRGRRILRSSSGKKARSFTKTPSAAPNSPCKPPRPSKPAFVASSGCKARRTRTPQELPLQAERLRAMIEAFRADLAQPDLPFIACTIGEMKLEPLLTNLKAMNEIQLALPRSVPHTACVDARDLKTHIGDAVHFDTAAQNEIGKRFAAKLLELLSQK